MAAVEQLIREAPARGEREAGRFTLAANHRSTRAGVRLARHAIESSVGSAVFVEQLENSLLARTHVSRLRLPRVHGHRDALRRAIWHGNLVPSPSTRMDAARGQPATRRGSRDSCARAAPASARPTLPAASAVPSPYETGDFRGSDIFCPLRATEVRAARDLETGATN